jgi:hypothetical protein
MLDWREPPTARFGSMRKIAVLQSQPKMKTSTEIVLLLRRRGPDIEKFLTNAEAAFLALA